MAQNWTPEQLEAITRRDCSLLVAAGAGAGKTAVLVERIIRKITDSERPVDIDRLLVVTFTNAAATEMRERIGDALTAALEKNPASQNLHRQMALLDRASIMTLHSFCLEVVRNHFHSLDLDPLFRIADETESALLRLDVLEELFEEKYETEENGSIFFQLVDSYGGGRDDSALREMILTLHRFTQSDPWPEQWLTAQAEAYNIGASASLSSTPWARVLLKGAAAELQGLAALLEKAAARAARRQGLEPYCGILEADLERLRELHRLCEATYKAGNTAADTESTAAAGLTSATHQHISDIPLADRTWDVFHEALSCIEYGRLPRCGKDADPAAQDEVKAVRSQMKERLKKLYESGFDATAAQWKADFEKLYPQLQYLSAMVCRFEEMFQQKKKSKGILDFNDLEHYCLKALLESGIPTPAATELSEKYEEILVDEYQDSNLIQELILQTVSGKQSGRNNIFMVGDVKQSIYRFRQAKPELFMTKYLTYPHESGHDSQVIQLYKNFRSRAEVISGVNFVFRQIMSAQVGELDYTHKEYLNPGAQYDDTRTGCTAGGAVEVHLLDVTSALDEIIPGERQDTGESGVFTNSEGIDENKAVTNPQDASVEPDEEMPEEEESLDNIQSEARIVGKRIKSLVSQAQSGFVIYDKKLKDYRTVQYRDIVILMRATRNWADIFTDELAAMGIPAYADAGMGYFRTVEVETILSLLQIIDNPIQDIPMLAVLRSPIGRFTTDELADIRLENRSVTIYEAMQAMVSREAFQPESSELPLSGQWSSQSDSREPSQSDTGEPFHPATEPFVPTQEPEIREETSSSNALQIKTAKFLNQLQRWRKAAQYTPTDELVWQLLTETGYYSYAGILPGGPERQANLRMLFERARQYEETSYKGLFNFINFINRLRSGGGDMGSAKILGENDNVVRIMSIHKSKGLEFPVVILAGCGKRFNMMDLNSGILLHQELGFGPDLVDLNRRTITPTMSKFAIRQKLRLETLSEEMRILYVAFTRAREKLIITGSVRNLTAICAKWCATADTTAEELPPYSVMQASCYLDWIGPAIARHESGEPVRLAAELHEDSLRISEDQSCWEVKLWGIGAAKLQKGTTEAEENIRRWLEEKSQDNENDEIQYNQHTQHDQDMESSNRLIEMLQWQYPYRKLSAIPVKISVTELKRRFLQEEQMESAIPYIPPMVARPLFMEAATGLSAAAKGTIMHFVMQNLDLVRLAKVQKQMAEEYGRSADAFIDEIREQIASMKADEKLTEAEAQTVCPEAVAKFFETSVGQRMLASGDIHREMTFNIEIKCTEIYGELAGDLFDSETMLLQGVIDCWFESEGSIVLLDYKTDHVPEGGEDVIRKRYEVQIGYYVRALEKTTGKRVAEKYLYLFHTGQLLHMR